MRAAPVLDAAAMTKPEGMTYGEYLTLEPLLSAQHPVSAHHDELLFIIMHQTKELWLKQIVHELRLALDLVRRDRLIEVHKNLSRVSRIQAVMTLSWDVLATLTPSDYMTFRSVLGTSSGFQSAQFRQVEFLLGLKDGGHLKFQEEGSAQHVVPRSGRFGESEVAVQRRNGFRAVEQAEQRAGHDYGDAGQGRFMGEGTGFFSFGQLRHLVKRFTRFLIVCLFCLFSGFTGGTFNNPAFSEHLDIAP